MANEFTIQTIQDGPRNAVIKISGVLDTSDLAQQVLIDPALLAGIDNTGLQKAAKLRLERVIWNCEPPLAVNMWWDATVPVRIEDLTGQGHKEFRSFGGLTNNAGAGVTGKVLIGSQGWTLGAILSFTATLEFIKQQR